MNLVFFLLLSIGGKKLRVWPPSDDSHCFLFFGLGGLRVNSSLSFSFCCPQRFFAPGLLNFLNWWKGTFPGFFLVWGKPLFFAAVLSSTVSSSGPNSSSPVNGIPHNLFLEQISPPQDFSHRALRAELSSTVEDILRVSTEASARKSCRSGWCRDGFY